MRNDLSIRALLAAGLLLGSSMSFAASNLVYCSEGSPAGFDPGQYTTGTDFDASANGALQYLAPAFEQGTIRDFMVVEGAINGWQEHESPYRLLLDCLQRMGIVPNTSLRPRIGLCPSLPFFMFDGLRLLDPGYAFTDASVVTAYCRQRKSAEQCQISQGEPACGIGCLFKALAAGKAARQQDGSADEHLRRAGHGSARQAEMAAPHRTERPACRRQQDQHGNVYSEGSPSTGTRITLWKTSKSTTASHFANTQAP